MRTDLALAAGVVGILAMMIVPLPPALLDLMLTTNISLALLILLVSMYILKPVEFSVFPALLLVMTLFRLALNVAATRLVLLHGHEGTDAAGAVISAFGQFVVGGNFVVGVVVFAILVVIQFIVITKGAGRIAEVAARFTLDAMPGKQMAIDAELNAGVINEGQARARREAIAREADFYGSMDGASKFVRGDAIAGLIITTINIVGGLAIGVLQQGLGVGQALQTYATLTIGDGLVTQLPALLISTSSGIIVTRAAADSELSRELLGQLTDRPRVLLIAGGILGSFGLIPGLPTVPFLLIAATLWLASRGLASRGLASRAARPEAATATGSPAPAATERVERRDTVEPLDLLSLEVGYNLIPLVDTTQGGDLLERVKGIRRTIGEELGFVIPPVRIRDNLELRPNSYTIRLKSMVIGQGELYPGRFLAMNPGTATRELEGLSVHEPTFGVPATWISASTRDQARALGYTVVDAATVLATHLSELARRHAPALLTRQAVQELLDGVKTSHPACVEGLVPNLLPLGAVHKVLQLLLAEEVSIRDLPTILESLADAAMHTKDPALLAEWTRVGIPASVVKQYLSDGNQLSPLILRPSTERLLREGFQRSESIGTLTVDPSVTRSVVDAIASALQRRGLIGGRPALLCSQELRPHLRRMVERALPHLGVLSFAEVPSSVTLVSSIPVECDPPAVGVGADTPAAAATRRS
jgi:flagellar biosynthesis protein FlhA